jgi:hypothetical protein
LKIRYKIGKFSSPVSVCPGDKFNLILTEYDAHGNEYKQKVGEDIEVSMTVTHWVMFYVPGTGFGGIFGGPDIGSKMSEIFVEPELVNDDEILIA